jgi:capsular polysaccharide biosynthesis protein
VLGSDGSGHGLSIPRGDISATNPPATVLIDVTATSKWPGSAKTEADLVAHRLAAFIPKVAPRLPDGRVSVTAMVTQPAIRPASPSSPRAKLNFAIGLLLGLAGGLALALIRDPFSDQEPAPKQSASA